VENLIKSHFVKVSLARALDGAEGGKRGGYTVGMTAARKSGVLAGVSTLLNARRTACGCHGANVYEIGRNHIYE